MFRALAYLEGTYLLTIPQALEYAIEILNLKIFLLIQLHIYLRYVTSVQQKNSLKVIINFFF